MNSDRLDTRRVLACLGDESRFRVMLELVRGDRCVTDLAGRVGLSQSCTTRHLQTLEREGLVRGARSGKRVFFSVSAVEFGEVGKETPSILNRHSLFGPHEDRVSAV